MIKRAGVFILLLLSASFALAAKLDGIVAVVNNKPITESELNAQAQLIEDRLLASHAIIPSEVALRKKVLQHLIDVRLQLQAAERMGVKVAPEEINHAVADIAARNQLSLAELNQKLVSEGISEANFRKDLEEQIILNHVQGQVVASQIEVSAQEIQDYLNIAKHQKNTNAEYHMQHIVVTLPENSSSDRVKIAEVKAADKLKDIHQGRVSFDTLAAERGADEAGDLGWRSIANLPEVFAKAVPTMKVGDVIGPIRSNNGFHLLKLTEVRGAEEAMPPTLELHVRGIFVKKQAIPESMVKTRFRAWRQAILSGTPFSTVASQHSEEAKSAARGGDMGWLRLDEWPPILQTQLAALPVHHLSEPLATDQGWYLLEVLERRELNDPLASRRQQARMVIFQQKFEEQLQVWLQALHHQAYIKTVG